MKKLMVAILVLAAACVYAQMPDFEYENDFYGYKNGVFTIKTNGDLNLTYYSEDSKYGQIKEFGYYNIANPTKQNKIDTHLTGNETVTISGLQAGDEIGFYINTKFSYDKMKNVTVYSSPVTDVPKSLTSFHVTDDGYTFGDTKWEARVLGFAVSVPSETTPSGQPLPGALTTMLVAGGCAA